MDLERALGESEKAIARWRGHREVEEVWLDNPVT